MTPATEAAGISLLQEQQAIDIVVQSLLADADKKERHCLINRQLYRITAERLTEPAEIEAATHQIVGDRS
ncbi:hypothetical protein M1D97_10475 [Kushneria sp. AK178]